MNNQKQYQADYRMRNPAYVERQKRLDRARQEARRVLCFRYPEEYEEILRQIKVREGL